MQGEDTDVRNGGGGPGRGGGRRVFQAEGTAHSKALRQEGTQLVQGTRTRLEHGSRRSVGDEAGEGEGAGGS